MRARIFLRMAVHTARHGRQIRNLRHARGYPASTVGLVL